MGPARRNAGSLSFPALAGGLALLALAFVPSAAADKDHGTVDLVAPANGASVTLPTVKLRADWSYTTNDKNALFRTTLADGDYVKPANCADDGTGIDQCTITLNPSAIGKTITWNVDYCAPGFADPLDCDVGSWWQWYCPGVPEHCKRSGTRSFTIVNRKPNDATRPTGPTTALKGDTQTFSASATDPDGQKVKLTFDWGDGSSQSTSGFVTSGSTVSMSHTWSTGSASDYCVKAYATDESGDVSQYWSSCHHVSVNSQPNAPGTPSGATSGEPGQSLTYSASATDPEGHTVKLTFDWGDGTPYSTSALVASGQSVSMSHSYTSASPTTFCVRAYATDSQDAVSATWSGCRNVEINSPPNVPATPTGPAEGDVGQTLTYTTSASDPDGHSVTFTFTWGDGTPTTTTGSVGSGQQASASHAWSSAGTRCVQAYATDSKGRTSGWSPCKNVAINTPPNTPSTPSGPSSGEAGQVLSFTASATDGDGNNVQITFQWGDGASTTSGFVSSGQAVALSHAWSSASGSPFCVKARATDTKGSQSASSGCHYVTINSAPHAPGTPSGPSSGGVGESLTFSASATDPDGHNVQLTFDWGDGGSPSTTGSVSSGGTASASHAWGSASEPCVKARATDTPGGLTGPWSGCFTVRIQSDCGTSGDAGNVFSGARAIGSSCTGRLAPGLSDAEDWYKFQADAGQTIQATLTPPSCLDYDVTLWNPVGGQRTWSPTSGCAAESITFRVDETGEWRLRIVAVQSGAGTYSLTRSVTNNQAPHAPSSPSPASGASRAHTSPTLTWTGGDPDSDGVTHDVFGALHGHAFTTLCSGSSAAACSWAGRVEGATYLWYVRARDAYGAETTGPQWSFTTDRAPTPPTGPTPTVGATVRALTGLQLSWNGGTDPEGDTVTYTVYLESGDSTPDVAVCTTTSSSCQAPTLAAETLHYWRVVASDGVLSTDGPTWSFWTNRRPFTPHSPGVAPGAIHQPPGGVTLTWTGGDPDGDPTTYAVYVRKGAASYGTATCSNVATASCASGSLDEDSTYTWRVHATDGQYTVVGPEWTFHTNRRPAAPAAPSPVDGAIRQARAGVPLSWTASDPDGDALTFSVVFGKAGSALAPLACAAPSVASCATGPLAAATKYEWRVTASDGALAREGPTWSLTTNRPPYVPHTPVPEDGAQTFDPRGDTLRWTGGDPDGDAVTYTVHVGRGPATSGLLPCFTATVAGMTVTVSAACSTGASGGALSYAWEWGDGTSGSGQSATHTYLSRGWRGAQANGAGAYAITLTVREGVSSASVTEEHRVGLADADLALHWAPVFYHDTAQKSDQSDPDFRVEFDEPTAFDFDGDWRGDNNWENALGHHAPAEIYYHVHETESAYYLGYALFHPRDFGKWGVATDGDKHENDMETVLLLVQKDGTETGRFLGVLTMAHNDVNAYRESDPLEAACGSPAPRLEWGTRRAAYDGDVAFDCHGGGKHVILDVEHGGHGIYNHGWDASLLDELQTTEDLATWWVWKAGEGFRGGDGNVYYPDVAAEVPGNGEGGPRGNDKMVRYRLIPIDPLWERRYEMQGDSSGAATPFHHWAGLYGIDGGAHKAHAPWGIFDKGQIPPFLLHDARNTKEGREDGLWFEHPQAVFAKYFSGFPTLALGDRSLPANEGRYVYRSVDGIAESWHARSDGVEEDGDGYSENDVEWRWHRPGAARARVLFSTVELEPGDVLEVGDGAGGPRHAAPRFGATPWIEGDTVVLRFIGDGDGRIAWGWKPPVIEWDEPRTPRGCGSVLTTECFVEDLDPTTSYSWWVVASDGDLTSVGGPWEFTTLAETAARLRVSTCPTPDASPCLLEQAFREPRAEPDGSWACPWNALGFTTYDGPPIPSCSPGAGGSALDVPLARDTEAAFTIRMGELAAFGDYAGLPPYRFGIDADVSVRHPPSKSPGSFRAAEVLVEGEHEADLWYVAASSGRPPSVCVTEPHALTCLQGGVTTAAAASVHNGVSPDGRSLDVRVTTRVLPPPSGANALGFDVTIRAGALELAAPPTFLLHGVTVEYEPTPPDPGKGSPGCQNPDDTAGDHLNIKLGWRRDMKQSLIERANEALGQNPWAYEAVPGVARQDAFNATWSYCSWYGVRSAATRLAEDANAWLKSPTAPLGPYDGPIWLVAHSLGGLAARTYAEINVGDGPPVSRLATLGTPNLGTCSQQVNRLDADTYDFVRHGPFGLKGGPRGGRDADPDSRLMSELRALGPSEDAEYFLQAGWIPVGVSSACFPGWEKRRWSGTDGLIEVHSALGLKESNPRVEHDLEYCVAHSTGTYDAYNPGTYDGYAHDPRSLDLLSGWLLGESVDPPADDGWCRGLGDRALSRTGQAVGIVLGPVVGIGKGVVVGVWDEGKEKWEITVTLAEETAEEVRYRIEQAKDAAVIAGKIAKKTGEIVVEEIEGEWEDFQQEALETVVLAVIAAHKAVEGIENAAEATVETLVGVADKAASGVTGAAKRTAKCVKSIFKCAANAASPTPGRIEKLVPLTGGSALLFAQGPARTPMPVFSLVAPDGAEIRSDAPIPAGVLHSLTESPDGSVSQTWFLLAPQPGTWTVVLEAAADAQGPVPFLFGAREAGPGPVRARADAERYNPGDVAALGALFGPTQGATVTSVTVRVEAPDGTTQTVPALPTGPVAKASFPLTQGGDHAVVVTLKGILPGGIPLERVAVVNLAVERQVDWAVTDLTTSRSTGFPTIPVTATALVCSAGPDAPGELARVSFLQGGEHRFSAPFVEHNASATCNEVSATWAPRAGVGPGLEVKLDAQEPQTDTSDDAFSRAFPIYTSADTVPFPSRAPDGAGYYRKSVDVRVGMPDGNETPYPVRSTVAGGAPFEYVSPVPIVGDGIHALTFRGYHPVTGQDLEGEKTALIRMDRTPPVSTFAVGEPRASGAVRTYVSPETPFRLAAEDPVVNGASSGLHHVWRRLLHSPLMDGAWVVDEDWVDGAGELKIAKADGAYAIPQYATDRAGNEEALRIPDYFVDGTPPATSFVTPSADAFLRNGTDLFLRRLAPQDFTAQDPVVGGDASGVEATRWLARHSGDLGATWSLRMDWTRTIDPVTATFPDGRYALGYRSVDRVRNEEVPKERELYLDQTPPDTSTTIGAPRHDAARTYVTSASLLDLPASDPLVGGDASGVAVTTRRVERSTDAGATWTLLHDWAPHAAPVSNSDLWAGAPPQGGLYRVSHRSEDRVGNLEAVRAIEVFVDDTPPATTLEPATPRFEGSRLFVTSATPLTLLPEDPRVHGDASGVAIATRAIWRSADLGATWTAVEAWAPISEPFALDGPDGLYAVEFRSKDPLGNEEAIQRVELYLDDTPPETDATIGFPRHLAEHTFVAASTPFTLPSLDPLAGGDASGVARTEYRVLAADGKILRGWTLYEGAFTLPGPDGLKTVEYRSFDRVENAEAVNAIEVFLDTTPPRTTDDHTAPDHRASGTLYVAAATEFSLASADPVVGGGASGVATTEFRVLDGSGAVLQGWTPYAPFTLPGPDGTKILEYHATDRLGNAEKRRVLEVFLDTTPPTSAEHVGDPVHGSPLRYVTSATRFVVTSADEGAGLKLVEHDPGTGAWTAYAPFRVLGPDGPRTVRYRATDHVGNVEPERTIPVHLDNTPPTTTVAWGSPSHAGDLLYVTSATPFTLSATDLASGVAGTHYRFDDGPWTPYEAFTLSGPDGPRTLQYRSIDRLGNREPAKPLRVFLDNTPPATTLAIGSPRHLADPTFVTSGTPLALEALDAGSGVDATEGRLLRAAAPGGVPVPLDGWTPYSAGFTLAGADGAYFLEHRSRDRLGNEETVRTGDLFLDNTPPELRFDAGAPFVVTDAGLVLSPASASALSAADPPAGGGASGLAATTGEIVAIHPRPGPVASLALAGLASVPVAIDGDDGPYEVRASAEDLLGNAANATFTVLLDRTAPVARFLAPLPGDVCVEPQQPSCDALRDRDADGYTDGEETLGGSDPARALSTPHTPNVVANPGFDATGGALVDSWNVAGALAWTPNAEDSPWPFGDAPAASLEALGSGRGTLTQTFAGSGPCGVAGLSLDLRPDARVFALRAEIEGRLPHGEPVLLAKAWTPSDWSTDAWGTLAVRAPGMEGGDRFGLGGSVPLCATRLRLTFEVGAPEGPLDVAALRLDNVLLFAASRLPLLPESDPALEADPNLPEVASPGRYRPALVHGNVLVEAGGADPALWNSAAGVACERVVAVSAADANISAVVLDTCAEPPVTGPWDASAFACGVDLRLEARDRLGRAAETTQRVTVLPPPGALAAAACGVAGPTGTAARTAPPAPPQAGPSLSLLLPPAQAAGLPAPGSRIRSPGGEP